MDRAYTWLGLCDAVTKCCDWAAYNGRQLLPHGSGVQKPQARRWQNRLPLRCGRTLASEGPVHPLACSRLCGHVVMERKGVVTS